jgi:tRNA-2-methylthio-N6-dimethylallyladenosine synthase
MALKKQRLARLAELQNEISLEINKNLVGQSLEVLVEGRSKTNWERWSGRTRTGKIVVFTGEGDLAGKILDVTVEDAQTWNILASVNNYQDREESLRLKRI